MYKYIRSVLARRTFAHKLRNKAMNTFSSYEIFNSIREKQEQNRQVGRKTDTRHANSYPSR